MVKVNLTTIIFCGLFASCYIGGGLFGALLSSLFTKKIQNVVLIMKILVFGHSIASVLLYLVLKYQLLDPYYWEILILINSSCVGFFVYTIIPLGLDLGSSCSFPNCTESSSNGLLIISGQTFGLLLTLIMRELAKKVCICSTNEHYRFGILREPTENLISNKNQSFLIDSNDPFADCPKNCIGYDYSSKFILKIR